MNKYIFEKQVFFVKYDMIRFDVITLNKSISIIKKSENNIGEIYNVINYLYSNVFEDNIREILIIMKSLLENDKNYTTQKLISGLEVIEKSVIRKEKEYYKYVDMVYNL